MKVVAKNERKKMFTCLLSSSFHHLNKMRKYPIILFLCLCIEQIHCAFWNDIPARCVYDRTTLFSCWNTTFVQSIPLFNDLAYTLQNHRVQIRDSNFQLSLIDLFAYVGTNIEQLVLINNTFSSMTFNQSAKIYFRSLQTLQIQDRQAIQWFQLNCSYFPQLIKLDLSYNQLTNEKELRFNQQNFPVLKLLDLSHNQLRTIDHFSGSQLDQLEILILSFNPLQTIINEIGRFSSLVVLDLSSTSIKQLGSLTLLPRLERFHCRQCKEILLHEYETFFGNCSHHLIVNISQTTIHSFKSFNSSIKCFKDLTIDNQSMQSSMTIEDFSFGINLENLQLRFMEQLTSIQLNIYDRLKSIDFSENKDLTQVHLYLKSDYIYLQRLRISHTMLKDFAVNFNSTTREFLHVDVIDMSDNRLESVEFLRYLTFFSLDLSFNRLKIIDIDHVHFRHGMYELTFMNLFNLSSNQIESAKIHWDNESPHTIDFSSNNLQSVRLDGQTTYTLFFNNNPRLAITPATFALDVPLLQYLDLASIQFDNLENLIYLHNLSNIRTLILNNNQLRMTHRTLNWNIFYPWHRNLTHVSLKNISLEKIERGVYLRDYYHLLTVDLYDNDISCNCLLEPFITWLKVPPPPLADFYEPLNKVLSLNCPVSLVEMSCNDQRNNSKLLIVLTLGGVSLVMLLIILKIVHCYIKRRWSKPYDRMDLENDFIALDETNFIKETDGDN